MKDYMGYPLGLLLGIMLMVALWACVGPVGPGTDGGAKPGQDLAWEWYRTGGMDIAWVFHFPDGTTCYRIGAGNLWCK